MYVIPVKMGAQEASLFALAYGILFYENRKAEKRVFRITLTKK
mgnify:CR=1 FL=1